MNRHFSFLRLIGVLLLLSPSCSLPAEGQMPQFDTTYLQKSRPSEPTSAIELGDEVTKQIRQFYLSKRGYHLFFTDNGPRLRWLDKNTLVLSIDSFGTYSIDSTSKGIRSLPPTDLYVAQINYSPSIKIGQPTAYGYRLEGRIIDQDRQVRIEGEYKLTWYDVTSFSTRNQNPTSGPRGTLTNAATGKRVQFDLSFEQFVAFPGQGLRRWHLVKPPEAEEESRLWFRTFYVSPNNRYYLWSQQFYPCYCVRLIDTFGDGKPTSLITNYGLDIAIDPDWKTIAVLKERGGDGTIGGFMKTAKFYIEFHDLSLPVSETQAAAPEPAVEVLAQSQFVADLEKGWRGIPWGVMLTGFRSRFPKHSQESGGWITGEGIEDVAGIWITGNYVFNKHDRLSTVSFTPKPEDRDRLLNALTASLGQRPQEKDGIRYWNLPSRNVVVSMMIGNGTVTIMHVPLAGD